MKVVDAVTLPLLAAMLLGCEATPPRGPGSIVVTYTATVPEPGLLQQYTITVDDGTPRTLTPFQPGSFAVNGLAHGTHVVTLSTLPPACDAGGNRREVQLRGDDTARVSFEIRCTRLTGDVRVSVTTTGSELDVDGYLVLLDQMPRGFVQPNGQATLQYIPPGSRAIALSGVASNCTAGAPQTVTVAAGVMASATFTVTCVATAVLKTTVAISGADPDADGLSLKVGQGAPGRAGSGTTHMTVPSGQVTWTLGDVQPNCTLSGASTGSATVAAGDTLTVAVSVDCTAVGYGTATTVATDPAADTLGNSGNASKAHDIVQLSTRYAPNWLILVMRFARPVGSVGEENAAGLQGFIELDVDENVATGHSPVANSYGGTAQQGVDYAVLLFEASATSVALVNPASEDNDTFMARVPLALEGDSVIIRIPLAKLGGDDGNMSISSVVGTLDRPTDIAPNTGVILARAPAGTAVAPTARAGNGAANAGTPRDQGQSAIALRLRSWRGR